MKKLLNKIYLLTFLLFLLPSLNLGIIYSHGIGKLLIMFIFILIISSLYKKKIKLTLDKNMQNIFLLFFTSQVISIFSAMDINSYLSRFEDLIFVTMFFMVSFYTFSIQDKKNERYLILTFFISLIFNTVIQMTIYLYPDFFINIAEKILHPGYVGIIKMNIERQRIYFQAYDEMFIPFIFYIFAKYQNRYKVICGILLLLVLTITFLSNFRTKFIMAVFAFLGSIIIFSSRIKKYFLLILTIILILTFMIYYYSIQASNITMIDRLFLTSEREDIETITSRINQGKEASEIALSSLLFLLFGVGLGNYNYYAEENKQIFLIQKDYRTIYEDARLPHNIFFLIFAEAGLLGLMMFILLLLYFIKKDLRIIKEGRNYFKKAFVLSFWTLFLYSLFNPTINFSYNLIFWSLRGLVRA